MSSQLGTDASSQRSHCRAKSSGAVPVQPPVVLVSSSPSAGAASDRTGALTGAGAAGATSAVGSDVLSALPAPLVAVTRTRMRRPTSPACNGYCVPLWPVFVQLSTVASVQRSHTRANAGAVPFQVPFVVVSV